LRCGRPCPALFAFITIFYSLFQHLIKANLFFGNTEIRYLQNDLCRVGLCNVKIIVTWLRAKEEEDFGEGFFPEDKNDFSMGGDGFGQDDALLRDTADEEKVMLGMG